MASVDTLFGDSLFHTASESSFESSFLELSHAADPLQIFQFCFLLYGSLGLLWIAYTRLPQNHRSVEAFHVGMLCLTWCCMSIGMHLLNKTLVSSLGAPCLVSIAQMAMAAIAMAVPLLWDCPKNVDLDEIKLWCIVPIFFCLMLISANYTYELISLSLLTCVRNLAPLIMLPIEYTMNSPENRPTISWSICGAILVMLAGALMYAGGLKDLSMLGIFFACMNMVTAISDRLVQRRLLSTECKSLPLQFCTVINNSFAIIPSLAICFFTGEMGKVTTPKNLAAWSDPSVLFLLALSGAIGLGICYFGLACQRAIAATSFMVLQNVSKIGVIGTGICFFGDPVKSPVMAAGLAVSIMGSFWYGKSVQDANAEKAAAAKIEEKTPLMEERAAAKV